MEKTENTFLGTEKISVLMRKFAIPSIIAMLVSAMYNIIDQLFIGQSVGIDGNAATNIAFPLTTSCIALALLFGIGGASCFNLSMGSGDSKRAAYFAGNSSSLLFLSGVLLMIVTEVFLHPILSLCGAEGGIVEEYAAVYVRITAIGFPFMILTTGGGHIIRADGSPQMTMICNIVGAVINVILDALFILVFDWGMAGAAFATVIGQAVSAVIVICYLRKYKTVKLKIKHFIPRFSELHRISLLGMASCFNQITMMVVQIVMNQLLSTYGENSKYGATTAIAVAGIVMKVFQVFFSFIIGLAQGSQPIESYNYGAKKYDRVRGALWMTLGLSGSLSIAAALIFQIFPEQILSMFGKGDADYVEFGVKFFRIFLLAVVINFFQPVVATFFTSIGKAYKGVFLSLTRQFIFLMPLLLICSYFWGLNGIMYAAPTADLCAFSVTLIMMMAELKSLRKLETAKKVVLA
ncbi:MAG: MATE family efflux transporter [Ruminococcus sp.]|nr:MATE family efflux transporter [Ruminococcus sp.]